MIIQLNPPIPMSCPKGQGLAILLTDYGCEFDHMWTIAIDSTGELWTFSNREVRMLKNITTGRLTLTKQKCMACNGAGYISGIENNIAWGHQCSACKGIGLI